MHPTIELPIQGLTQTYPLSPSKIFGVGLNYLDHITEQSMKSVRGFQAEKPPEPVIFPMTPNILVPHGAPVILPAFLQQLPFPQLRTDYEAELAFIVKDTCKNVPVEEALSHVLGYTCMNDISQRELQNSDTSGWFRGKSLDTFGPVGPVLVLAEDLPDPQNLSIRFRLNGKETQASNTRNMIFSVAEILSFLSKNFTLLEGDLVTTGTPSGVGPIQPGDLMEVEIQGIGTLQNPVHAEAT